MFEVIVETNDNIPNREAHVERPLARIVAQAFEFALKPPYTKRTLPRDVPVTFEENAVLEEGVLAAITVRSRYSAEDVNDVDRLRQRIAETIRQSSMFNCWTTRGEVRLELQFHVRLPVAQAT